MNVRLTTPQEWLRTEELFALAFEIPMERKPDAQPDKALHWAAFDTDGEMMSTLTVTEFPIQFDGSVCRMGGIGGVATLPQYRRRGGIRGCFTAFLPELYQRGYDFSYLYPFSTCFYRQFGYENCIQKLGFKVDLALLKPEKTEGTYRLAEPCRDLRGDIRTLDAQWERTYNLSVQHGEDFYKWVAELDPAVKQEFCFVWYRPDGTPGAYTVYKKVESDEGRHLLCSKFCFTDKQGFRALLSLFKSQASDHSFVKFATPDDPALRYLMPEWSLGAASWLIIPAGMVRVIRVEEVLKKAKYQGSGHVVLRVDDPMIPENNASFSVSFRDGKAAAVEKTEEAPDAAFTIPAFSALITGACDFAAAQSWMDGITVNNPAAPLSAVFYRKPLFLSDYF